jgi:hypothetical protein
MLSSITPLGERGRNNKWWMTVSAFVLGSLAGGLTVGAVAGAVGSLGDLTTSAKLLIAAIGAAVALMLELRVGGLRLPSTRRQVNENWLQRYRGWVYGLGFGFQLGTGFLTIMTTAAVPLTFVLATLTGAPITGAAVGGAFGLARGLMVLPARRIRDTGGLVALHRRIAASAGAAAKATTGLMAAVAIACVIAAMA